MTPGSETGVLSVPVSARDHALGPVNAPVTMVEYGDFECPSCGAAHPIVKEVQRLVKDRLRFVFRHFPLAEVHPHAQSAAEAAEVAGAQGRFWEMHGVLFENQDALEVEELIGYAVELGLDAVRVARELAERTHEPRVRADFMSGVRSGVNGTPTFFINGLRHDLGWDLQTLLTAVESAAEEAETGSRATHPRRRGRH